MGRHLSRDVLGPTAIASTRVESRSLASDLTQFTRMSFLHLLHGNRPDALVTMPRIGSSAGHAAAAPARQPTAAIYDGVAL